MSGDHRCVVAIRANRNIGVREFRGARGVSEAVKILLLRSHFPASADLQEVIGQELGNLVCLSRHRDNPGVFDRLNLGSHLALGERGDPRCY